MAPDLKHADTHLRIEQRAPGDLESAKRTPRRRSKKAQAQLEASIRAFGFNAPVLIGPDDVIVAGHARVAAAKAVGLATIPTVRIDHLSPAELRAYAVADNRSAELATWDRVELSLELQELSLEFESDIELTGFDGAELEVLLGGVDEADEDEAPAIEGVAVTRLGDVWTMGDHRLICGDALSPETYTRLMAGEAARMLFTDPPYNVPIDGFASGNGKHQRREFAMASGEMNSEEFTAFLTTALQRACEHLVDGAVAYVCMDWRHMAEVGAAGATAFSELKNLCVWNKSNAGMGTFYRSQHELVFVFKHGRAPHLNTFGLGEGGRYRTNVWDYPGLSSFGAGRDDQLEMHATPKPVALVADAIKDVSRRGDIVLDGFAGSGATLAAAERTGRRARLIEIDPLYCDVICRRWQALSGRPAVLEGDEIPFDEVQAARQGAPEAPHG